MLKRLIPLFFILLLPHFLRAQDVAVYPIDVTAIITPPYGTCLKDYVGSRRFMVNVLLRDMTKRPDDFVIEMSVKNSGNRVVFRSYFGNLSLNPGKPFYQDSELQNGFISQLFDPNNILVGNQFATKCFDEGAYSISFQAFAAYNYPNRRIPLSRASTSTLFMQSTVQGPYLIFPYDKDSLDCSIATINYQWQSANPTGEAVSYHLQVVEVPEGFFGYNSFETATTFVENQPNLFHSTFQSIVSAAKYRPNTTYAWRVIVKTREHEHISPVRTFVYCGTPQAPVNEIPYDPILTFKPIDDKLHPLHIDSVDTTSISALAYWKKNPEIAPNEYCGIAVEVRKQGQEKWTPYRLETADTSKIQLENLSYGTLYEARGQYIKCDGEDFIYGPYGDTIQFIIPDPVRAADCGDDIPPLADCGDNKGKILGIGDTIFANGTNVIIDTVFYSGEDSTIISGKGHIEFPIIRNVHVKMEFNDIQINCAGQLAKGVISTIYDPSTSLMIDVEELIGQGSTGGADNPVSNSEVNKYDKESFDSSPEGSFFVKDDSTVVMKDENGTEVPIGKLISLSSDQYASKNSLLSPSHFLEFINLDPKNIAFDKDTFGYYSKIAPGDYHKYSEAGDRNYIIPWLANNPGKTKKLYVKEVLLDRKVSLFDSVKFVMPTNGDFIELNHTPLGEGFFSVDIPGGASTKNSFEVYALGKMKESSSYGDAGKLMVVNYPTRKNKVIFVPIQNDYKLSNELEKSLNDIYGRLGITYEVELAEKFENELLQEILSDGLDISADDESRWQVESEEMKMLRYLYRQHLQEQGKDIEKNAAYIFLVDKAQEPYQSVEGDMPRNQSVGYIFMQGNTSLSDARLVAHELGHGVYRLQHTFDYKHAEEDKYKTDNLMDYNGGSFLAHYQWRVMQDSVMFVWKVLQEDEDGMKTKTKFVENGHYIVSNNRSLIRDNKGNVVKATNADKVDEKNRPIIPIGTEVICLERLKDGLVKINVIEGKNGIYTSLNNLTIIETLSTQKQKKYEFVNMEAEVSQLPFGAVYEVKYGYSETIYSQKTKRTVVQRTVYEKCGDYFRIDEPKASAKDHKGVWMSKDWLRNCVLDRESGFDFVTVDENNPNIESVIESVEINRNRINDRTDPNLYNSILRINETKKGTGYYYPGIKTVSDELIESFCNGKTEFERHVQMVVINDLKSEGGFSSVNGYDGEILTLGKGNTIKGPLSKILYSLYTKNEDIKASFNAVGMKMTEDKRICVLDTKNKKWLCDHMKNGKFVADASNFIINKSDGKIDDNLNSTLLSFFIELFEKDQFKERWAKETVNQFLTDGAGRIPSYVFNKNKTAYADSWSDETVARASHLEHWLPAGGWNSTKSKIKQLYVDSKGELKNVIYAFTYGTCLGTESVYKEKLNTDIYIWKATKYNYLGCAFITKAKFKQLFNNNYIKDIIIENVDKVKKVTWNSDSKSYYLENKQCVVVQEVKKVGDANTYVPNAYVVTKDASGILKKEF